MLSENNLERVEKVKQEASISSLDNNIKNHGSSICPFCLKHKAYVYEDKFFICYSSKCGIKGDVISINSKLNNLSYFESLSQLEKSLGISNNFQEVVKERTLVYEQALEIYKYILLDTKEGKIARDYLEQRNIDITTISMYDIGYAPSSNPLKAYGIDSKLLAKHQLINNYDSNEYYANRIIFPIRDTYKRVIHFVGRYCGSVPKNKEGEDSLLRYKNSKSSDNIPTITNYFIFEDFLNAYNNLEDVFICEGYPDSLSLMQLGLQTLGILGLQGLTKQYYKLSKLNSIVCVFDNDFYDIDHPNDKLKGQFKSWVQIIPQLVEIQQILPKLKIYTWMVPDYVNDKRTKDVNDYLTISKLPKDELLKKINIEKKEFVIDIINRWGSDITKHLDLLKVISATGRGQELLSNYISDELKYSNPINYALKVFES